MNTKKFEPRTIVLTSLAMLAFAGNSLLCRAALVGTSIDPASFTSIRLVSGAVTLWLIFSLTKRKENKASKMGGSWLSALSLFVYALAFSFAYLRLTTATGALLLFGSVQLTMLSYGILRGERLSAIQVVGFLCTFSGLLVLLLPGLSSPPIGAALLMVSAGIAWGVYSILGASVKNAIAANMGNFSRSIIPAIAASLFFVSQATLDSEGVFLAIASGAIASGLGYAIWYAVLPSLSSIGAASVQLSVPIIAGLGGVLFFGELVDLRLLVCSVAVLGGIALVILFGQGATPATLSSNTRCSVLSSCENLP